MDSLRLFSVLCGLGLAGGVSAYLFHDPEAARVELDAPSVWTAGSDLVLHATIRVPAGQRLPIVGTTVEVESVRDGPPLLRDEATCWADTCEETIRHAGPGDMVASIRQTDRNADPAPGQLWIRVEGYGHSESTGYGAEVEPQRRREATDVQDESGREGYGMGYGSDQEVVLRYVVGLRAGAFTADPLQITFIVQTGSHAMGLVSSPRVHVG